MKRPKLKRASKRVSCSKRYKIQKKVREHNRKLKKDAKKKGVSNRVKKDPGVPNIAPFKEEVLREAELRRLKLEAEKEKKKVVKQERAKKRKKERETGVGDADKVKRVRKEKIGKKLADQSFVTPTKKYLRSELNKVIDASDVIVEILDARDPLGCRCPQLEEAVLKREGNKKLMFLLNKIDLVPKENVQKWLQCLQLEFPTVVFKASTLLRDKTVQEKKSRMATANGVVDQTKGVACFGSSCLLQLLGEHARGRENESTLKVGVVGFPNVGKSSLINSLKGMRACNVGFERGITKSMQEVHIAKNIKMVDSPGIVASPSNPPASMALRSLQVEEKEEDILEAVRTLLKQCNKEQIMLQYNVPDFRNSLEFLTLFAKKRGYLQKGGVPNTQEAAVTFLSDWTGAKLSYHSKANDKAILPPYLSDAIVTEMQKGWDLNMLRKGNEETMRSVKFPNRASSIGFTSKGPTAGILTETDIPEERPAAGKPEEDVVDMEEGCDNKLPEDKPEEMGETETSKEEEPATDKPVKVKFLLAPVTIDPTSVKTNDAYDFNTDFN
ncbi:guanine nucleotide-binding protein-like 3 [Osmerus eperlanus]|uniref:guanine nucleotide-binding protein-like 3 n=1 Tax=Osmerus eperlanus TaxID=29151 RepID=UPI002E14B776